MRVRERDAFVEAVWQKHGASVPTFLRRSVDPEHYFRDWGAENEDRRDFRDAVMKFMRDIWPGIVRYAEEAVAAGVVGAADDHPDPRAHHESFQRRLRRFAFVAERVVQPLSLLRGDFDADTGRISWEPIRVAFQARFSRGKSREERDALEHRDSLRVWWTRNRQDMALRQSYVSRMLAELAQMVSPDGEDRGVRAHRNFVRGLVESGMARQMSVTTDRLGYRKVTLQEVWEAVHPPPQQK